MIRCLRRARRSLQTSEHRDSSQIEGTSFTEGFALERHSNRTHHMYVVGNSTPVKREETQVLPTACWYVVFFLPQYPTAGRHVRQ